MPLDFGREAKDLKTYDYVIGVDEAGRGPIAGPVVAGAFCFYKACNDVHRKDPGALSFIQDWPWRIVGDSKTFTEKVRETIYEGYLQIARGSDVREADVSTIADASTAPASLEQLERPQQRMELEVALSSAETSESVNESTLQFHSSDLPSTISEVEVSIQESKDTWAVGVESPLFDHYSPVYFDYAMSQPTEIDRVNILEASLRSMTRSVYKVIDKICHRHFQDMCESDRSSPKRAKKKRQKLKFKVLVDGNRHPHLLEPGMILGPIPPTMLNGEEGDFISLEAWQNTVYPHLGVCSNEPIIKGDASILSIAAGSIVAKVVRDRLMRQLAQKFPAYNLEVHKGYPTPSHDLLVRSLGPTSIHRLSFAPIYEMLIDDPSLIPPGRNFEEIKILKTSKKKRHPKESSTKRLIKKPRVRNKLAPEKGEGNIC